MGSKVAEDTRFFQDTVVAIQEVRACAKADQELPKIELKDLDEALATMNEATGLGADRFGPRFIQSLPKDGRQKLVDLLNQCEEQVAWPWQVYVTLVCLLAKEVKGERPIPLLTMLYRIWSRTRKAFVTLGRCCERQLTAAGCSAMTGGRRGNAAH